MNEQHRWNTRTNEQGMRMTNYDRKVHSAYAYVFLMFVESLFFHLRQFNFLVLIFFFLLFVTKKIRTHRDFFFLLIGWKGHVRSWDCIFFFSRYTTVSLSLFFFCFIDGDDECEIYVFLGYHCRLAVVCVFCLSFCLLHPLYDVTMTVRLKKLDERIKKWERP